METASRGGSPFPFGVAYLNPPSLSCLGMRPGSLNGPIWPSENWLVSHKTGDPFQKLG